MSKRERHGQKACVELDPPPMRAPGMRACAVEGCTEEGAFKAPRDREHLRDYQWLCLEHVREFNRAWDYFQGMASKDVEQHIRDDVTWHRPTFRSGAWKWSALGGRLEIDDPFGVLGDGAESPGEGPRVQAPAGKTKEMLQRLDLDQLVDMALLKRRYKELVKQHHPDLRGGDRRAEERLKLINEAYTYLVECGELA